MSIWFPHTESCPTIPVNGGGGKISILTGEETTEQGLIPVVERVNMACPLKVAGGIQVVLMEFDEVKLPPELELHAPPVAEPPILPAKLTKPP